MKNYKIAVAGTGYVGLSLGVLFAQHHQVVAVDIVQAKVDMINNKKSPIQDTPSLPYHSPDNQSAHSLRTRHLYFAFSVKIPSKYPGQSVQKSSSISESAQTT